MLYTHRTRSPSPYSRRGQRSSSPSDIDTDDDTAADTLPELPSSMLSRLRWIHARSRISSSMVSSTSVTHETYSPLHHVSKDSSYYVRYCFGSRLSVCLSVCLFVQNSPDMNPVDNSVWEILQEKVYKHASLIWS